MSSQANQVSSSQLSLESFLKSNSEKAPTEKSFDKESERLLRIDVDGSVIVKPKPR